MSTFHALPLSIVQLSLPAVLKCGQSFRWHTVPLSPPEYRLCLSDRVVCLYQSPDTLFYRAVFPDPQPSLTQRAVKDAETLGWLNDYFQLDVDLEKLYTDWAARDPVFASLQTRFAGIRMLRQDPWENLISWVFVSSAPRIFFESYQVHMLFQQQHYPHHKNGTKPLHALLPSSFIDARSWFSSR